MKIAKKYDYNITIKNKNPIIKEAIFILYLINFLCFFLFFFYYFKLYY